MHAPYEHVAGTPAASVAHVAPQPPQFATSLDVLTHAPPHDVVPGGQAHAPAVHGVPAAHA
jgi:hypothetical protein